MQYNVYLCNWSARGDASRAALLLELSDNFSVGRICSNMHIYASQNDWTHRSGVKKFFKKMLQPIDKGKNLCYNNNRKREKEAKSMRALVYEVINRKGEVVAEVKTLKQALELRKRGFLTREKLVHINKLEEALN